MVVAILGIAAVMGLNYYADYRERIRLNQAIVEIRGLDVKVRQYYTDNYSYPATLADIGAAGQLDPWGNAYRYLDLTDNSNKGKARKNKNLVPINSDFDLYSIGRDADTVAPLTAKKSQDDVVRANDGRFVGLASDYEK